MADRPYTDADYASLMLSHLQGSPDLGPLPEAEQRGLLRALAKEPGERYPGAETMFVAADERLRVREALADLPQKEKTCCVGCSSKVVTETKSAGS